MLLLLASAGTTSAQGNPRCIGYLSPNQGPQTETIGYIREAMAAAGAIEGRNYVIEARFADVQITPLGALAAELAARDCAVTVAAGPAIAHALSARPAMRVVGLGDLAKFASLAGCGPADTRLTGVDLVFDALNLKRLEMLAQLLPARAAVVVVAAPAERGRPELGAVLAAARGHLGLTVHEHYGLEAADIEQAFAIAQGVRAAGLYFHNHPVLSSRRGQAIALAAKARLPVMYQWPVAVRDGGLIAYGPETSEVYRQLGRLA